MAVYVVTGKLGGGKSLVVVARMIEALQEGRKVATNMDLHLHRPLGKRSKATYMRLPDKPTIFDLQSIGKGNDDKKFDENRNGILALDECGTWFNSRNWQDKTRNDVNDWFLHARKLRWDIYFIVQDVEIMDTQARRALAEMTAFCRRTDRLGVPLIGPLFKLLAGERLSLPKVHVAKVVYGTSRTDVKVDTWVYRGKHLYTAYDTEQVFLSSYDKGTYCTLSPARLLSKTIAKRDRGFYMRLTKIVWRKFASPVSMAAGALLGVAASLLVLVSSAQPMSASDGLDAKSSDGLVEVVHEEPLHVRRLRSVLERLVITGTMHTGRDMVYLLADINDESLATRFTSRDLARMGLPIKSVAKCRLDVAIGADIYPLFCLQKF